MQRVDSQRVLSGQWESPDARFERHDARSILVGYLLVAWH
jgi:hypothetical protein